MRAARALIPLARFEERIVFRVDELWLENASSSVEAELRDSDMRDSLRES